MLFTDIEGSTRLARTLGGRWPEVVAVHHRLVGDAIGARGGHVQDTAGDSFFALFDDPVGAVAAAADAQRALAEHPWPAEIGQLRVRMGIHTGVVQRSDEAVTGLDIHLAARVQSAAHGGQVVLTAATHAAVAGHFALATLGEHRLKDFPQPERLFQLVHDGRRPDAFPPLRSAPVRPTNLPAEPQPLLGRDDELAQLRRLLVDEGRPLVTLLGLGGTGKTRLAVAAGAALLADFAGGVWVVALAAVRDPAEVVPAIALALGVPDDPHRPLTDVVAERLQARRTLLILDNLEQLGDAAPALARLLEQAPGASALITSQLPLRVGAEHLVRLGPLPVDAASELFARRAAAARPGFTPEGDHEAIQAICERLGGSPLAIELAAARVALMTPPELLQRLDSSLGVLTRGPRDLEERHRSLRATLDWTHELLGAPERTLLARMAVFAGPAPLEAIEAIAGPDPEILDALAELLDAGLVRSTESRAHGVRFVLAQAVREFAAERLTASGDEAAVRAAHATHVAAVFRSFPRQFGAPDAVRARVWALDLEVPSALAFARTAEPALHLRMAIAASAVALRSPRGDAAAAAELRAALDRHGSEGAEAGWATVAAGSLLARGGDPGALALVEEGLAIIRADVEPALLGWALLAAGVGRLMDGDYDGALAATTEALDLARAHGDAAALGTVLAFQAQGLTAVGRLDEAEALLDEADALRPVAGDSTLDTSTDRGELAAAREDWPQAARHLAAAVAWADRLGLGSQLLLDLEGLTRALIRAGCPEAGLEVHAISAAISEEIGTRVFWKDDNELQLELALERARTELAPEAVREAVARGAAVPAGQRVAQVLAVAEAAVPASGP